MVTGVAAGAADLAAGDDAPLEQARTTFRAVYPVVERGDWSAAARQESVLRPYVLWPDLRAAWFRAKMSTAAHGEIETFLDSYGILKPARELRYRYALHLAGEGHLDDFLAIYQQYYQGLNIARLDCIALQAELEAGREKRIVSRALELWAVGSSQSDECDPVFANLRTRGLLTDEHYAERFALAIEARRFRLARYLSGPLDPSFRKEANAWLEAESDPAAFVTSTDREDSELTRRQMVYAIERLGYRDPVEAHRYWQNLAGRYAFSASQVDHVERHIALWSARKHQPESIRLLSNLTGNAANVEAGRWLVRATLRQRDWPEVVRTIDALPSAESGKSEWQYWKAIALRELGADVDAALILASLAEERSYYGFLAADALDVDYALEGETIAANARVASTLDELPGLIRARELYYVGLEGRGRSEWDATISTLTDQQQLQAALLAHDWGWHSRAISTVAAAGAYDDLSIRYPLPWREDFETHAGTAGIMDSWAYGVARSESLFMRDVRSSAGAIGLMQLMPATGRETAREINLPYAGITTLTDTDSNIRLGTWYLGKMYDRFGQNRVLATAAYNAGPHRVEDWLPQTGALDARIWIENIPFNETRGYVRRVLTDEAIFHWRMTGKLRRISDGLPLVVPDARLAQSAD
jgi:soluble lytic murein transglycosylase